MVTLAYIDEYKGNKEKIVNLKIANWLISLTRVRRKRKGRRRSSQEVFSTDCIEKLISWKENYFGDKKNDSPVYRLIDFLIWIWGRHSRTQSEGAHRIDMRIYCTCSRTHLGSVFGFYHSRAYLGGKEGKVYHSAAGHTKSRKTNITRSHLMNFWGIFNGSTWVYKICTYNVSHAQL